MNEQRQAENQYEEVFRQQTQLKALKNLKLIIAVFTGVQLYCLIYALAMFFTKTSCEYPTDKMIVGVFVWTLTRTMQYLIWIYPIMYIFWPKSLQAMIVKKFKCCLK